MSTPPLLAAARKHRGQAGPINTCMSNGVERWAREAGIAPIDGNGSCSQGSRQAHAGHNGWKVIPVSQARPGDVLYWRNIGHVSVVDAIDHVGNIRSIGSGGPSGLVAYQPAGGGFNAPSNFREAWRPPAPKKASTPAKPKPASKPAPKPSSSKPVTVKPKPGEGLYSIADRSHISHAKIKELNPWCKAPDYVVPAGHDVRIK